MVGAEPYARLSIVRAERALPTGSSPDAPPRPPSPPCTVSQLHARRMLGARVSLSGTPSCARRAPARGETFCARPGAIAMVGRRVDSRGKAEGGPVGGFPK